MYFMFTCLRYYLPSNNNNNNTQLGTEKWFQLQSCCTVDSKEVLQLLNYSYKLVARLLIILLVYIFFHCCYQWFVCDTHAYISQPQVSFFLQTVLFQDNNGNWYLRIDGHGLMQKHKYRNTKSDKLNIAIKLNCLLAERIQFQLS